MKSIPLINPIQSKEVIWKKIQPLGVEYDRFSRLYDRAVKVVVGIEAGKKKTKETPKLFITIKTSKFT